jgi:7-carboxy-7-deazaguanine synthase
MEPKKLPVIELFGPTIQGEGALAGHRTHFIRFGGCGYRCNWCDSMHAVLPEEVKKNREMMSPDEIMAKLIHREKAGWITLTGGDPAMHDLYELVTYQKHYGKDYGFQFAVETQGQLWQPWMHQVDLLTVSPKPPSSGEHEKIDYNVLSRYMKATYGSGPKLVFKFVVFDNTDLEWVIKVLHKLQMLCDSRTDFPRWGYWDVYLSVGSISTEGRPDAQVKEQILKSYEWLCDTTLKHREQELLKKVIILPQLHVLAWGTKKGV